MICLYFIFFLGCFYLNYKRNGFNVSTLLLSIYLISSLSSIYLLYGFNKYDPESISLFAITIHILCLSLFLAPLIYFGNKNIDVPQFNLKVLNRIAWLAVFFSITNICVSIPKVFIVFSQPDMLTARTLYMSGQLYEHTQSIWNYISSIGKYTSIITIFLFFYYKCFTKNKLLTYLLLISTFSIVFSGITAIWRVAFIQFFYQFLFAYILFRKYLKTNINKKKLMIILSVFLIIIVLVAKITIERFAGRDESIMFYVLDYAGQSFINFSFYFDTYFDGIYWGRKNFAFLFPSHMQVSIFNLNDIFFSERLLNVFGTLISSFFGEFGCWGTCAFALFTFLMFNMFLNSDLIDNFVIIRWILFLIWYDMLFMGVFYYTLGGSTPGASIIAFLIIAFMSYFKFNRMKIKI
ncbi:MAG TPA: O-antigen polymerase [Bacteroidales bacterium]|nr:O-antigen polymerase [Bacteroidales bacterium]